MFDSSTGSGTRASPSRKRPNCLPNNLVSEKQIQPQRQNNHLNQNTQATIMAHLAILGTHPHHPHFCACRRPPWFFCQGFSVRRTQTTMMAFFAEQYMLESLTIQGGGRVRSVLLLLLGSHVLLASPKTYSDPISCHAQCKADLSHNVVSCNNEVFCATVWGNRT